MHKPKASSSIKTNPFIAPLHHHHLSFLSFPSHKGSLSVRLLHKVSLEIFSSAFVCSIGIIHVSVSRLFCQSAEFDVNLIIGVPLADINQCLDSGFQEKCDYSDYGRLMMC